jgi:hypothetical protein
MLSGKHVETVHRETDVRIAVRFKKGETVVDEYIYDTAVDGALVPAVARLLTNFRLNRPDISLFEGDVSMAFEKLD